MKRALAILISFAMLLTGCSLQDTVDTSPESSMMTIELTSEPETSSTDTEVQIPIEQDSTGTSQPATGNVSLLSVDTTSEEYINTLGFTSLNDQNLMRYVEDTVYSDLVNQLGSDRYFVENVEAVYISKEYLDELAYNSQENIYFGYKLSELDEAFQGEKYIFTLGENGQTDVVPFEEYDDTYDKVIRNIAIGTGVILLCVTVSVVTGGVGAPAVSMIFAASAKSATVFALSSGVISGVSAGVVEGIETHDFDKAMKAAALKGNEGFMWGACTGAVAGGASESIALKGATLNGLTMNEAAAIQKESKYPLDVIKEFHTTEEYNVFKTANLKTQMINGKTALVRSDIDLNITDDLGRTNLQRMKDGLSPLDSNGGKFELHHIGQESDATLAILTEAEHDNSVLHGFKTISEINRKKFKKIREEFWKEMARLLENGGI